jgi:hypothetical protein
VAYEIATIGELSPRAAVRAPAPIRIGELPDIREYTSPRVLVGAGAGVVVGLILGALIFGGRRG